MSDQSEVGRISPNDVAKIIEALIDVSRAAHSFADNTEEDQNNVLSCMPGDFSKLCAMLNTLDELPDPPGESASGTRKAEYWIFEQLTEVERFIKEVTRWAKEQADQIEQQSGKPKDPELRQSQDNK